MKMKNKIVETNENNNYKNIKHHTNTPNKNTVTLKDNKNNNKKRINQLSHAIIKHHIDYAPCITNSCM